MANRTDTQADTVHGTNPQYLVDRIIRVKIYNDAYWKEFCFGLTTESFIDRAAEIDYVGGTYGGRRRPAKFLCLFLKMLQIQPDEDVVMEYIKQADFKYLRALGAAYLRISARPMKVYQTLEPLFADYRKLRFRNIQGKLSLIHMDEFIDWLLREETVCDVTMPRIPKREILEETLSLPPRQSILEDDLEELEELEEKAAGGGKEQTAEKAGAAKEAPAAAAKEAPRSPVREQRPSPSPPKRRSPTPQRRRSRSRHGNARPSRSRSRRSRQRRSRSRRSHSRSRRPARTAPTKDRSRSGSARSQQDRRAKDKREREKEKKEKKEKKEGKNRKEKQPIHPGKDPFATSDSDEDFGKVPAPTKVGGGGAKPSQVGKALDPFADSEEEDGKGKTVAASTIGRRQLPGKAAVAAASSKDPFADSDEDSKPRSAPGGPKTASKPGRSSAAPATYGHQRPAAEDSDSDAGF